MAAVSDGGGQHEPAGAGDVLEEALKVLEAMNARNWWKQRDVVAGFIREAQRIELHKVVRQKFLTEMCGLSKDVYFFCGNMGAHPGSFLILGVFWPPIDLQGSLF